MTADELLAIFVSREYRQELDDMSSYLASIKQERPIIYSLAKFLWQRGRTFQLEDKHRDLVVDETHLEFKYNFDCDMAILEDEMKRYQDRPIKAVWEDAEAKRISKSWSVMPGLYGDMCVKKVHNRLADIFVWVICSRDLSKVSADARKRICWATQQCKWSETNSYSDRTYLRIADRFLERMQVELRPTRPFSVLSEDMETKGHFPSRYHFRICEFSKTGAS
jgi:hypothetical protein